MNYKPGDRVRCINNSTGSFTKDKIYTCRGIIPDFAYSSKFCILIEEDDKGSKTNGWCVSHFEPAYIKEFDDKLNKLIE